MSSQLIQVDNCLITKQRWRHLSSKRWQPVYQIFFFWRFKPKLASLNLAKPSGKELVESGQTDFLGLCRLCLSLAGSLYSVSISLVHRRIKGGTLQVYQHHINIQDASPLLSRGYCYHQLHLLLFDRLALITVSCAVTMKWAFLECNVSLYNKCL